MKEREIYNKIAYFQKNILKFVNPVEHNIKVHQKRYNSALGFCNNFLRKRNETHDFQVSIKF